MRQLFYDAVDHYNVYGRYKKPITRIIIYIIIMLSVILILGGCRGVPNVVNSPEDVEGKIIGGLAGTPSIRMADELGTAREFYSATEMMNELRAANIDCVIMESTTAVELVSNTSGVRILSEPLVEYELRIAVPMENTGLLNAINSAIEALHSNGTLRAITNKYFSRGSFTYEPPEDTDTRQGYLTIAFPPDSPPFSYKNEDGYFIGMDVEVAVAVSDYLGVGRRIIEHDAWELVTAVWHGRADLALGLHPGEGEGLINTSEPYARAVHVIIVRRR
ncbi:MAG: transporter substrate-binding domain-containing protein [Oscillospiraceae bacterium]|jgi:polar amino acid transport system substrate-binding protein|nr:transporter substrate-binding domain-containing protein [Oscillospiraceae bacterium]